MALVQGFIFISFKGSWFNLEIGLSQQVGVAFNYKGKGIRLSRGVWIRFSRNCRYLVYYSPTDTQMSFCYFCGDISNISARSSLYSSTVWYCKAWFCEHAFKVRTRFIQESWTFKRKSNYHTLLISWLLWFLWKCQVLIGCPLHIGQTQNLSTQIQYCQHKELFVG